jgi:3-oxoacyl-[acyl-carrier protein] reductase
MNFEGRTAVVTGASRGIGKVIALQFAKHGADVACIATSQSGASITAAEVKALGRKSLGIGCDISNSENVEKTVEEILADFGKIDILINNAGITKDTLLMKMTDEDWDSVINVNLKGTFNMIRAVSRSMIRSRSGRIINLSSIVGLGGQAGQANYAASKAGVIGLTKSVAKELGSRGITCNCIAPGFIETEMTEGLPAQMREQVVNKAPLGRLGSPEDIAGVALFLASEESSYMTGQVLVVDGGLTL